ncbi:hypothetical protein CCM_04309 [Cordyceps militaris CM01]|uniref:NAD dependent epimerase n=1 Tax=Cordyceps militaris (strain CM01) TaxID=983644 RepID=G3JEB2_CORMM|nr:uncharacterized protein CCM_04309 [Cordyceps militaris CM01]EGX92937.1 hypothetical protein CCM_04309 [Cordyceps militaris CM01]
MSRLIDRLPQPDKILDKKLIVLSKSRTGTFSMYQCFQMLGYKPYHMYECVMNGYTHMSLLNEALRNKYLGEGKPYDKADFDKWLANYDTVVEIPSYFVEEFIEYYPDAMFILTERDLGAWDKSLGHLVTTVTKACHSFPLNVVYRLDNQIAMFTDLNETFWQVIFHGRGLRAGMSLAQADYVKELLDVKLEDGFGWEEICPFLGVPIPKERYPRGNAPAEFDKLLGGFIGGRLAATAYKVVGSVVVSAIAIGAWYYTKQR